MSRILSVLKNRNKIERKEKQRRREELSNLKLESAYRARLHEDMKMIEVIFSDDSVKSVVIEIPKQHETKFMRDMYKEEMSAYSILQIDELHYELRRKMVNF